MLPIRWRRDEGLEELTGYLRRLAERVEVVVVDGSPPEIFARHARAWPAPIRHLPPHPDLRYAFGKVNGVITGVREASHERVVLADDDVRYDDADLARVTALLDDAELVRPQNHFSPLPWHARWDSARSLVNRALSGDYPGTFALRRGFFLEMGGYDGDVLFENLELMRTVAGAGGRVLTPLDLFVRRLPPTAAHFWSQRVRQAYDDFALPARMAVFLAILPAIALAPGRLRGRLALALAAGAVALAETGRRRGGGRRAFPPDLALFAPAWVLERAVCCWLAVGTRVARGGVPYGDVVLTRSATPARRLWRA